MSDFEPIFDALVNLAGRPAVQSLTDLLDGLGEGSEAAWKRTVFRAAAELMESHGLDGIQMAVDAVERILDGEEEPDLSGLSLRTASDLLVQLQNAEADRRGKAKLLLTQLSQTAGTLLAGILKGVL